MDRKHIESALIYWLAGSSKKLWKNFEVKTSKIIDFGKYNSLTLTLNKYETRKEGEIHFKIFFSIFQVKKNATQYHNFYPIYG